MLKSIVYCFGLTLKSNQTNYRRLYSSNLWIGRIENQMKINGKDRDSAKDESSVCNRFTNEIREELGKHFCRRIETQFGFNSDQSRQLSAFCLKAFDNNLNSRPLIDRSVQLLAKHFAPNDVFFNPQIFCIRFKTLSDRLAVLKELSLERIQVVGSESCYRTLLQTSVRKAKSNGLYKSESNVITHLVNSSQCEPHFRAEMVEHLTAEDVEAMSFETIHRIIKAKYISLRFDLTFDESLKIVDNKYSRIYLTPLATIVANCRLLLDVCKVPANRLLRSTYLLTVSAENVRKLVDRVERIGGQPLINVYTKYPKLLDIKFETLVNNLNILRKHFTEDQISRGVPVLTLNTKVLTERVALLTQNEDLKPFLDDKRVLRIVVEMRTALNRLDCLKSSGRPIKTIDHLIASDYHFDKVILGNEKLSKGLNAFTKAYLNIDLSSLRSTIGRHPREKRFRLKNAVQVYEYLMANDVTNEQFINGLFIVLYNSGFVKHKFEELFNTYDKQNWKSHSNLIQLLIYSIEKDYGHSGNGVYVTMD